MGIGSIDAGPGLKVDFRNGIPEGWSRPERAAEVRTEVVQGAVPFHRNMTASSIIPGKGQVELPCGFSAKRIFLLGCTVSAGKPLVRYGAVEVHYASGTVDVIHLTYGFTFDGQNKVLSPSKAMYLGRSGDPFQYVLSLAPSAERIDMIRLVSNPGRIRSADHGHHLRDSGHQRESLAPPQGASDCGRNGVDRIAHESPRQCQIEPRSSKSSQGSPNADGRRNSPCVSGRTSWMRRFEVRE